MSLADLLGVLEEDAADEIARAERDSAAEADRILAAARRGAEERHDREVAAATAAATAEAARLTAAARREAARSLRAAREEELAAVLAAVRQRLAGPERPAGTTAALAAALDEALAAVPDARRVLVDPRDVPLVQRLLAERRSPDDLEVTGDLTTDGGVVVAGPGRSVDDTAGTRLAAAWPALRAELSEGWRGAGTGGSP